MIRSTGTQRWRTPVAILTGFMLIALGARAGDSGEASAQEARPPVLLVTIDTLRHDGLGVYGGEAATPALDALAARGVRFDNAVAHAVLTLPSHASILTGLDPSRHGVHDNSGFRVSETLETWAERLGAAGYATGAFIAAFPLDSRFGLAQGFDVYDDFYADSSNQKFQLAERPAQDVVTAARRWLRRQRGDWFAWVHVFDPHAPYLPPAPYDAEYPDDPYAGEIAYTDAALAPLLADAERLGALVIVTSDHGEARGEHGELTHGVLAYNSTIRVPLIVAGPGVAAAAVADRRVGHADLMPTVLERLGIDAGGVQGRSFVDILDGDSVPGIGEEVVYFESLNPNLTRNWAPLRGVFQGPWKFIDLPLPELYDVIEDPDEENELSRSRGSRMVELYGVLQEHLEGATAVDAPLAEDAETLRQLRSLGYLGSSSERADREYGPEDDPKNLVHLDALVQRAVLDLEANDLEAAIGRLETVLEERPDFVVALTLLASAEYTRGNLDGVVVRLRAASQQEWATTELRRELGFYLHAAGLYEEAADVMGRVVTEQANNAEAWNQLSLIHRDRNLLDDAEAALERALELDPTYAELYVNRADLLMRRDNPAGATAALEQALQYDPTNSDAHNMRGAIAYAAGRLDEAFEHWRTAIAHNPEDFAAMRNLGIELVRANRFPEAVAVLEQLFGAVPPAFEAELQIPQLKDMVARIKRDQGIQ
jgi:arylsulfatase A-like enzyme/Tfp pilus assembly protein PilF